LEKKDNKLFRGEAMNVLITGGTGFIGSHLCNHFINLGHKVFILTRDPYKKNPPQSASLLTHLNDTQVSYEVIINLAGEPLNKHRWDEKVKKHIYDSRIETTRKIIRYIQGAEIKPKTLISGSAIGFYGHSTSQVFNEESPPADQGFTHQLCADWEAEAMKASAYGVRVCTIRTGIVLDQNHGALAEMLPAFRYGLGAQLGDGKQWMSWIHRDDVIKAIDFLITHANLSGSFNLTAPVAVTNGEFTRTLAHALHRPSFLKLPPFVVKTLFGEMGEALLLQGQRVIPERLSTAGYTFMFPTLDKALGNIFG